MTRIRMLLAAGLLIWLCAQSGKAGDDLAELEADDVPAVGSKIDLTFTSQGVQPGEHLPRLIMNTLDGQTETLDGQRHQTTLLLTSSFTCPKSRSRWPDAAKIIKQYGKSMQVIVVYVIEAHPVKDASPYKGVEDVTEENQHDKIFRRQPKTFAERLKLAHEFEDHLKVTVPIYVDGMDNAAWMALGGGPNMAVLVRDGVVQSRQGWFDADDLRKSINRLLAEDKQSVRRAQSNRARKATPKSRLGDDEEEDFSIRDAAELVETGKVDKLNKLLETMPELAKSSEPYHYVGQGMTSGQCMLPHAAEHDQFEVIDLLIEHGANINVQSEAVPSALYSAAKAGKIDLVRKLLDCQANVNQRSSLGISPLDEAVIEQHDDVSRLLIEHGAEQDVLTHAGLGDVDAVERAVEQDPARAFLPDPDGRTPLVYAAATDQIETARLLLPHGGLVPLERRFRGENSLSRAESPADWAALHGHAEMLNLLLDSGDPLTSGQMHDAVKNGHLSTVKVLIQHGADLEARNHYSDTPWHLAAKEGRPEIAQALIDAGADIEAKVGRFPGGGCGPPGGYRATNETPLHLAARYAHPETAQVLLSAQADVNARSTNRRTPLLSAIREKPLNPDQLEVIKLLLDNGANVNAKDKAGETALSRAEALKDESLVALLRNSGAVEDVDDPDAEGDSDSDSQRGQDVE